MIILHCLRNLIFHEERLGFAPKIYNRDNSKVLKLFPFVWGEERKTVTTVQAVPADDGAIRGFQAAQIPDIKCMF